MPPTKSLFACLLLLSGQALFAQGALEDQSLKWKISQSAETKGGVEKLQDGSFSVSLDSGDAALPFFNEKPLPLEAGASYKVEMTLSSCDPELKPSLMLGFPANKDRKPPYLFANFKDGVATLLFTASELDSGLRIHLVLKGHGKAVVKSVSLSKVETSAEAPAFKPEPCFAKDAIPAEEMKNLPSVLATSLSERRAKLAALESPLKSLCAVDGVISRRVAKRLEMASRLLDSMKADLKAGDPDSLLFARRSLAELDIFIAYFEDEIQLRKETKEAKISTLSVKDFGAKGDGVSDDSDAFRAALEKAKSLSGNVTLLVPKGRYLLSKDMPIKKGEKVPDFSVKPFGERPYWIDLSQHLALIGFRDFTLRGEDGTEILFANPDISGLRVIACRNTTVAKIAFSYRDKLFTQGTVEAIDEASASFLWRKDADYPEPSFPGNPCCHVNDPKTGRLYREGSGKFIKTVEKLDGNLFKITIARAFSKTLLYDVKPGLKFSIPFRVAHRTPAGMIDSSYCLFESLELANSPSSGYGTMLCDACSFVKCVIKPAPGAMISTNADGLHCCNNQGIGPYVEACEFSGMGDDAFNVYYRGQYLFAEADGSLTTIVSGGVPAGALISVVSPSTGVVKAELPLKALSRTDWRGRGMDKLEFATKLPPGINSYDSLGVNPYSNAELAEKNTGGKGIGEEPDVYFAFANSGVGTILTGNRFVNNRNNGIVVQTDATLIEDNVLDNFSIAIRFGAFLTWKEGPPPRVLSIRGNRVSGCGCGIHVDYSLNTRKSALCRPMRGISIADNRISGCWRAMRLANIDGLELKRNFLDGAAGAPKIELDNVGGVAASGNIVAAPLSASGVSMDSKTSKNSITFK